jgi:hypothetical protein
MNHLLLVLKIQLIRHNKYKSSLHVLSVLAVVDIDHLPLHHSPTNNNVYLKTNHFFIERLLGGSEATQPMHSTCLIYGKHEYEQHLPAPYSTPHLNRSFLSKSDDYLIFDEFSNSPYQQTAMGMFGHDIDCLRVRCVRSR